MQNLSNHKTKTTHTEVITPYHSQQSVALPSAPTPKHSLVAKPQTLFPIWQISLPLSLMFVAAIGAWTALSMAQGRYVFNLSVSLEEIRIQTDIDKREGVEPAKSQGKNIQSVLAD